MQEIAARSPLDPGSNVIVNCVTPGACKSDLFRENSGWLVDGIHAIIGILLARSTEVGSRNLVHAVNPDVESESHGRFLMDCKVVAWVARLS